MPVEISSAIASTSNAAVLSKSSFSILNDAKAALVVAFMAIPMSLGIAIASGFPAFAGVIASVVAGLVVSFFMGSKISIKGPAGGLSAIVLGAVLTLGQGDLWIGYQKTLAVVVASGVFTVLLAGLRFGRLSEFLPVSTIHGIMAALGLLLVFKQMHTLFGVQVVENDALQLISLLPKSIENMNPKIALIGLLSLGIMVVHSYVKLRVIRSIPSPIWVVLVVMPLAALMHLDTMHSYLFNVHIYTIDPGKILVNIPLQTLSAVVWPDFSVLLDTGAWMYVALLTVAISIESLLSTKAIDKIDPLHRVSSQNKDLFAVGVGNICSGLLGGLPIISESKRSIINIDNGGKTEWCNFLHGIFVLILVLILAPLLRLIPLAALAGILVYTGAKLATPSEISKSYKVGREQFLIFIVTLLITVFSNFILGIIAGLLVQCLIHMYYGVTLKRMFVPAFYIKSVNQHSNFVFKGPALFSNFFGVQQKLLSLPKTEQITFDFTHSRVVDHSFLEQLASHDARIRPHGGQIFLTGLDFHKHLSDHPLASKRKVQVKQFNQRQLELKQLGLELEATFDPRIRHELYEQENFQLSKGYKIQWIENRLEKSLSKGLQWQFADVVVLRQGATMQHDFKMSLCMITGFKSQIPNFILRKEGFVDTLFAFAGFNDIDFESFPVFSHYYYLMGNDEEAIRAFFTPKVLQFFEQNRGFHIECCQNILIIYKRQDQLQTDEIKDALAYTESLTKIIG